MVSLEGTRTNANLKHAFSDAARLDRLYLDQQHAAETAGYGELARLARASAENGARYANGHLDYLVANRDCFAPPQLSPCDFAAVTSAIIDEHTDMYAGMARTARDEGFEEIADWFETLAKAGRSHAGRLWRVLAEYETKT